MSGWFLSFLPFLAGSVALAIVFAALHALGALELLLAAPRSDEETRPTYSCTGRPARPTEAEVEAIYGAPRVASGRARRVRSQARRPRLVESGVGSAL